MSQSQANAVLRVLEGKPRKYTVQIHRPDGSKVEFQTETIPYVQYESSTRKEWVSLKTEDYNYVMITEWERGMILLVEKNPDAVVSPS